MRYQDAYGSDGHIPSEEQFKEVPRSNSLPKDCISEILVRLPILSLCRMKLVCKEWNSESFLDALTSMQCRSTTESNKRTRKTRFLMCTSGKEVCLFDFMHGKWSLVSAPSIVLPFYSPPMSVVAAGGGLLCYGNQVTECKVLYMCNPFNQSLRALPATLKVSLIHKVSLITDSNSDSYKILVAGEDGAQPFNPRVYTLYTEIYESETNSWKMAASPLPDANFSSDPGICCGSVFYSLVEMPLGVVAFDAENGKWSKIRVEMPTKLVSPSLVRRQNKILLVGKIQQHLKIESITIWELRPKGNYAKIGQEQGILGKKEVEMEWVEIEKLPEQMLEEIGEERLCHSPLVCCGIDEDLICITSHKSPRAVALDLGEKKWHWLPQDPLFPNHRNMHLVGVALEPKPHLLP